MKKYRCFMLGIIIFAQVTALHAGWIIEQSTTDEDGSVMTETLYFQDNKIKDFTGEQSTIMDLEADQMIMENHAAKTYWQGSYSDMMGESENMAKNQMERMMENMTPEQREAYQQYMDQMEDETPESETEQKPAIKIVKKSSEATIAGYKATLYEIYSDGEHVEDAWISEQVPVLDEIDMERFGNFFEDMMGDDEFSYDNTTEYREMLMKGFPLKTVEYSPMGNMVTEVTSVEKKTLPKSTFMPPNGYEKVSIDRLWRQNDLNSQ